MMAVAESVGRVCLFKTFTPTAESLIDYHRAPFDYRLYLLGVTYLYGWTGQDKDKEDIKDRHQIDKDKPLISNTHLQAAMGVTVEIITPGDGLHYPRTGDTVKIHYVGTLLDGSKFDSSRDRNEPFETQIGVGKVIRGWDEGVPQLSLGTKAILTVTPDYGYGSRGFPPVIPAHSTLIFEVELLRIY